MTGQGLDGADVDLGQAVADDAPQRRRLGDVVELGGGAVRVDGVDVTGGRTGRSFLIERG